MRTIINDLELVYTINNRGVYFTIDSKIKLVKYYNNLAGYGVKKEFVNKVTKAIPEIAPASFKSTMSNWSKLYLEGALSLDNTFTISHQPKKRVTITLDDKIEEKQGYIAKLLADIEGFKRDIEVLKKAKELMGV